MSLRWSIAALMILSAGSVFAQSTPATSPAAGSASKAAPQQQAPLAPITAADKPNLSYSIGFQMGDGLTERKIDVDIAAVIRGLQDAYAKRKPTVAEDTMHDVLARMQSQMYTQAKAEYDKLSTENKAKSSKFLAENKSKKGVVTLPSGIQYVVIEEGTGTKHPTLQSDVTVHFRGSLMNGLEFDSSFARGQPVEFKVGDVLKGWQEILPLMRAGDYWRVYMPSDFAYGDRGQPPRIGPDEALVFELKLVSIK